MEPFDTSFQWKNSCLLGIHAYSHYNFIKQRYCSLDNIYMTNGNRIKGAGKNRYLHTVDKNEFERKENTIRSHNKTYVSRNMFLVTYLPNQKKTKDMNKEKKNRG
jgi:hypothetical protein